MKEKVIAKLARKSYSSWELKQKCREIPEIDQILLELAQKGYLDDQEWIKGFIRQEEFKGSSAIAIAFKMKNKGIPRDVIQQALSTHSPKAALERAITKKTRGKILSPQERQKLIASLLRKGFSWELIQNFSRDS